jgi:hypothetical protein
MIGRLLARYREQKRKARLDEIRRTLPGHREVAARVADLARQVERDIEAISGRPDLASDALLERASLLVDLADDLGLLDDEPKGGTR